MDEEEYDGLERWKVEFGGKGVEIYRRGCLCVCGILCV